MGRSSFFQGVQSFSTRLTSSAIFTNSEKSAKAVSSRKSTHSAIAAGGLAVQFVIGQWEKLYYVSLVLHIHYYYSFLCCLIKLSLSQPMTFTFCPFSSPSHCKERSEWATPWPLLPAAGINQDRLNPRLWLVCRKTPPGLVHLKWIQVWPEVSLPHEAKQKKVDNQNSLCRNILNYKSMVDTPTRVNQIHFLLHQMNLNMCPPPDVETWVLNDCQAVALWPPRWASSPPWMSPVRHPTYHSEKDWSQLVSQILLYPPTTSIHMFHLRLGEHWSISFQIGILLPTLSQV